MLSESGLELCHADAAGDRAHARRHRCASECDREHDTRRIDAEDQRIRSGPPYRRSQILRAAVSEYARCGQARRRTQSQAQVRWAHGDRS